MVCGSSDTDLIVSRNSESVISPLELVIEMERRTCQAKDPTYAMQQLGHTDPAFTSRV
jgi:hypothetical protein